MAKEFVCYLGAQQCIYGGSDDEARVPLGIPAASKQQKVLMSMEHKVKLPDHDYVVAEKHKLIPSVTGYRTINNEINFTNKASGIKYSGPTYVAVRSAKSDTSDAWSHGIDILRTFEIDSFRETLYHNDKLKPIIIWESDGAADQSAKSDRMKKIWLHIFKTHDIDYILHYNSPPGLSKMLRLMLKMFHFVAKIFHLTQIIHAGNSAYNTIERYMSPLSRPMCGVVLDHKHFGDHLDASKKTKDKELEQKNFWHAQQTLAELFKKVTVEGIDIVSEAVKPMKLKNKVDTFGGRLSKKDRKFLHQHSQEGSLSFQLFKCNSSDCKHCKPLRSNYRQYFPTGRIPVPVMFERRENGVISAVKPKQKFKKGMYFGDLYLNTRFVH